MISPHPHSSWKESEDGLRKDNTAIEVKPITKLRTSEGDDSLQKWKVHQVIVWTDISTASETPAEIVSFSNLSQAREFICYLTHFFEQHPAGGMPARMDLQRNSPESVVTEMNGKETLRSICDDHSIPVHPDNFLPVE